MIDKNIYSNEVININKKKKKIKKIKEINGYYFFTKRIF